MNLPDDLKNYRAPAFPALRRLWYRALNVDAFWRPFALVGLSAVVVILLVGCASVEPYWKLTRVPLKYSHTVYYESEDDLVAAYRRAGGEHYRRGNEFHGFTVRHPAKGIYIIHAGPIYDDCAERHEHAHGEGWTHPEGIALGRDCGPDDMK